MIPASMIFFCTSRKCESMVSARVDEFNPYFSTFVSQNHTNFAAASVHIGPLQTSDTGYPEHSTPELFTSIHYYIRGLEAHQGRSITKHSKDEYSHSQQQSLYTTTSYRTARKSSAQRQEKKHPSFIYRQEPDRPVSRPHWRPVSSYRGRRSDGA